MSFKSEWFRPGPIQDYKLHLVVLSIAPLIYHIVPPTMFYDIDS